MNIYRERPAKFGAFCLLKLDFDRDLFWWILMTVLDDMILKKRFESRLISFFHASLSLVC